MFRRRPKRNHDPDLPGLQKKLGYQFINTDTLIRALAFRRNGDGNRHGYDFLEKIGDRVLAVVICHMLQRRYPKLAVGATTSRESILTCNDNLAHVALRLGLTQHLSDGTGNYPTFSVAVLADIVEALIGGVAHDAGSGNIIVGLPEAAAVCERLFRVDVELAQVDRPWHVLNSQLQTRFSERPRPHWIPIYSYGQPVGYTCVINVGSRTAAELKVRRPILIGTGATNEMALSKASAMGLLRLWPKRYPHELGEFPADRFSWRIKAG